MIFDIGTSFAEHHTGRGTGFQKMFLFDFAKEKQPPGVDGCFFMLLLANESGVAAQLV